MHLKKYHLLKNLYVFAALVTLLSSFSVYKIPGLGVISVLLLLVAFLFSPRKKMWMSESRREMMLFGIGWACVYSISIFFNFCVPKIVAFLSLLYGILFLCLNKEIQRDIINKFVWALAIILFLSLIEFVVYQTTHVGVVIGHVTRTTDIRSTYFVNLLFNIIRTDNLIQRFQSLADEPGRIGTLCGFLLFFTWKIHSLRFPFYIFLISGILSFSLAFYIFLVVFSFVNFKINMRNVCLLVFVSFASFLIIRNSLELLIISRVEDTENIDNRTSETFDKYFEKAWKKGDLWFGVGVDNLPKQITMQIGNIQEHGNAGAKKWIYEYGILSFIIIFIVYNSIYKLRRGKMEGYDWVFLLVYWMSFYQRASLNAPFELLAFLAMPIINIFNEDTVQNGN